MLVGVCDLACHEVANERRRHGCRARLGIPRMGNRTEVQGEHKILSELRAPQQNEIPHTENSTGMVNVLPRFLSSKNMVCCGRS